MAMGAMGQIIGAVQGSMNQSDQMKNQQMLMGDQYKYNDMMANRNQQRAKAMWDYTNYANQVRHMEEAGLNPALLYGQSGGGGVTAAGGQGSGVSQPTDQSVSQKIRTQEMGLSLANMASQVKLNESQAMKNEAEAKKIAGADTKQTEATTANLIALTTNEHAKNELIYADKRFKDAMASLTSAKEDEVWWNIKNLEKGLEMIDKSIEGTELDNELKRRTMETNVKQAVESLKNTVADTVAKYAGASVNTEEAKAIGARVEQGWSTVLQGFQNVDNKRHELELQAEKIMNDLNLGKMGIDVEKSKIVKDYVLGIGNLLLKGAEMFGGKGATAIKGFGSGR